jgi:hypothetical protein
MIGRRGLVCFIAGTVISLVIDSVLYAATDGALDFPLGLVADAVAVGALLAVARTWEPLARLVSRWFARVFTPRLKTAP